MGKPTVLSFFATWCGPCKTFKPVVIELVEEGYSIEIIDIDEQQDVTAQHRISSAPTMIIEENGKKIIETSKGIKFYIDSIHPGNPIG